MTLKLVLNQNLARKTKRWRELQKICKDFLSKVVFSLILYLKELQIKMKALIIKVLLRCKRKNHKK